MPDVTITAKLADRTGLAMFLHSLALGTEFNDKPKKYFSLDAGRRLPKNAVTISKTSERVTVFSENESDRQLAKTQGIELSLVKNQKISHNKDKYSCTMTLSEAQDKDRSLVINKLLQESVRITESRQPKGKK